MDLYLLVRGPFVWASLFVFLIGCLYQTVFTLTMGRRYGKFLYPVGSFKGAMKSFIFGLLPFGSSYMRKNPVLTFVTVLFHFCIILCPLFLLAHSVLIYESWQILLWSVPEIIADVMTVVIIFSCIFFLARRVILPEIKNATTPGDVVLLLLILTPFLTGFLATHQWGPYRTLLITHIITGEILFAFLPFTRLGHMLFFWSSRAYMGAEYSKVLNAGDW